VRVSNYEYSFEELSQFLYRILNKIFQIIIRKFTNMQHDSEELTKLTEPARILLSK